MISFEIPQPRASYDLTHFSSMLHSYTSWERLNNNGFLMFTRGMQMENWAKMGVIFSNYYSEIILMQISKNFLTQ